MDGMNYRGENDHRLDETVSVVRVAKLLLMSVIVAAVIVGGMVLLTWAGLDMTVPSEF